MPGPADTPLCAWLDGCDDALWPRTRRRRMRRRPGLEPTTVAQYHEQDSIIVEQFQNLVEAFEERTLSSLRTAAYVVALQRVMNAGEQNGTWP